MRGPKTNAARPTRGGGHAQAQHAPSGGGGTHQHGTNPGPANNKTATTTQQTTTTPPHHAPTAADRHQHSTPNHEGGHAPTQHAPPRGGPRTNAARPTMGGGTHQHSTPHHGRGAAHQHSTPHHEGGRAPAQNPPGPNDQHNHNRNPTADHTHPNTPTVRRRREHRTNITSRAWRRLKHHHKDNQPEPNDASRQAAHTTTT